MKDFGKRGLTYTVTLSNGKKVIRKIYQGVVTPLQTQYFIHINRTTIDVECFNGQWQEALSQGDWHLKACIDRSFVAMGII